MFLPRAIRNSFLFRKGATGSSLAVWGRKDTNLHSLNQVVSKARSRQGYK